MPRGIGILGLLMAGMLLPLQAEACGISNWSQAINLDGDSAGVQGLSNRRYGGPCGLRVPLDGEVRSLTDESPTNERTFLVRFYAFLDGVSTSDPVLLYSADSALQDLIQIWYNVPTSSALTLRVFDLDDAPANLTFPDIGDGWHSIEFVWESASSAEIRFALNSDDPSEDLVTALDTSGRFIANANLGNLNAASGGSVDFDAYVSRRISRPGRLPVGDASNDGTLDVADIIANADEIDALIDAPGQPDCDENGEIDPLDVACIVDILDNQ